jgi:signal transduction histidine kinase
LHNLSQPLTAVWGSLEMLMARPDRQGDGQLERIQEALDELRALAEWIRVLGDIVEDHRAARPEGGLSLRDILREVIDAIRLSPENKPLRLDFRCEEDVRVDMNADLLSRAILFLLHDSFGAVSDGSASVILRLHSDEGAEILIAGKHLSVLTESIENLFSPFHGARRAAAQSRRGGFGLAIAKRIIELNNGTIQAEIQNAEDLSFRIRLPRSSHPAVPAPDNPENSTPTARRQISQPS